MSIPAVAMPRQRKGGKKKPARPAAPPPVRRRLDAVHLIAVVAGALTGLAFYGVVVPDHHPDGKAPLVTNHKTELYLMEIKGGKAPDGLFHVTGQVFNKHNRPCRLASLDIRFFDKNGKLVTKTLATVDDIGVQEHKSFSARAHVPGAVRFEVAVDLAHF
jgi:hypothetical protein